MKFNGRKPQPNSDVVVIPRTEGNFVFHLKAVPNYTEFDELYPMPVPPNIQRPGMNSAEPHLSDPNYISETAKRDEARMHWLVLKTISGTPGLEYERVDVRKYHTWKFFEEEMIESGFTQTEVNHLINKCFEVNSLSQAKLDQARADFLASQQVPQE